MLFAVSRSRTVLNPAIAFLFCFCAPIPALPSQALEAIPPIEKDAELIIRQYSSPQAFAQMPLWKELIINVDQSTRAAILANLPASYRKFQNHNKELDRHLNTIVNRALAPYNKQYSLVILKHPQPAIMHENYTVLVITTGLLERIPDDAALLMFIFHETAHDFFAEESIRLKSELKKLVLNKNANTKEAQQLVRQLILIELKCDAVATRLAIAGGQNTVSFSNVLLTVYKDNPNQLNATSYLSFNIHPSPQLRAHLIQSIAAHHVSPNLSTQSPELKKIKTTLSMIDYQIPKPPN